MIRLNVPKSSHAESSPGAPISTPWRPHVIRMWGPSEWHHGGERRLDNGRHVWNQWHDMDSIMVGGNRQELTYRLSWESFIGNRHKSVPYTDPTFQINQMYSISHPFYIHSHTCLLRPLAGVAIRMRAPCISTVSLEARVHYSLSSLSLCFPALQVGGIHVLFCPIGEQKVVKHLLLFHNSLSLCIWVRSARVCTSC
jgi:hypothetical protein